MCLGAEIPLYSTRSPGGNICGYGDDTLKRGKSFCSLIEKVQEDTGRSRQTVHRTSSGKPAWEIVDFVSYPSV